jgi:hypothetical protein
MPDFILPSKLVPERITVRFSLASELLPRETIVAAEVTVAVATGLDPYPENMLVGDAAISGTDVRQQVQCGLPGVIYRLTCTVTGSTGNTYQNFAVLAVLTDRGRTPPLNTYPLTSRPYPIEIIEGFGSIPAYRSEQILTWGVEGFNSLPAYISAIVHTILITYVGLPEGFNSTPAYVSADVRTILITYSGLPEGFLSTPAYVEAVVRTILITTVMNPEGFLSTPAYVGVTIT